MITTIQELAIASGLTTDTLRYARAYRQGESLDDVDSSMLFKASRLFSKMLIAKQLVSEMSDELKSEFNM